MRCAPLFSLLCALVAPASAGCIIIDDDDSGSDTTGAQENTDGADETGPATCFEAPNCDPLSPSCAEGKCVPGGDSFVCMTTVEGAEEVGAGQPCTGALACQEGLLCIPGVGECVGGQGCCTAICDTAQPQCPSGTVCTAYFSDPTICYQDVGVCVLG